MTVRPRFTERRDAWMKLYRQWNGLHYALGAAAVAGTSAVSFFDKQVHPSLFMLVGAGSALLTAYVTFFKPADKASAYHAAWQLLDQAIGQFELKPAAGEEVMEKGIAAGEDLLK